MQLIEAGVRDLAPGHVVGGRYTVRAVAGRGAVGTVYRVEHRELGSVHALKVLHTRDDRLAARILREGALMAALTHENVVRVSDLVDVGGAPGLVMEFVDGPTLAAAIAEDRLDWPARLAIAEGIVRGTRAAHAAGWVHRDLKPANVLLARDDRGWVPKITDFGLARLAASVSASSWSDGLAGTPAYMAPEQFSDPASVDARADVFAIGAVLFELATGKRAFAGDTVLEVQGQVAAGRHPRPEELAPEIPPRFAAAIEGALRVERDHRLPDCAAVLAVLRGEKLPDPAVFQRWGRAGIGRWGWLAPLAVVAPLAVGAAWAANRSPPSPAPIAAPAPTTSDYSPPDRPTSGDVAREAPTSPPPLPGPTRMATPTPIPRAEAAASAPVPVAAPMPEPEPPPPLAPARLTVVGDTIVELRRGDLAVRAGEVAPGAWEVWADFGSGFLRQAPLALAPGEAVWVRCNRMKLQCAVER